MSTLSVVPPSEPVEEIYIGSKPNWTDPDVAINSAVWFHQEGAADWEKSWNKAQFIRVFHDYIRVASHRFDLRFSLPVVEIENLEWRTTAKYYAGRNGMGLRNQITVNERYLSAQEPYGLVRILASFTTCLLQAHLREGSGKVTADRIDYFPTGLIEQADKLGIRIDRQGRIFGIRPGPFLNLLKESGIPIDWAEQEEMHFQPMSTQHRRPSHVRAGLRKWVCGCAVIVRHAGDNLQAVCLRCNTPFNKVDR